MKKKSLIYLIGLVLLSSCASQIEVLTPSSIFLNPEAKGERFKSDASGHHVNGSILQVSLSQTSSDMTLETTKSLVALGATGSMAAHEYLDLYIKMSTHSPSVVGMKLQVYGENQVDTHSDNISASILFAGGQNNYSGAGSENFGFNSTMADYTLNRTHTSVHVGSLIGWRFEKYILLYTGLIKIIENIHGKIDYTGSVVDGETIDINGDHLQLTLGYLYKVKKYNLMAEYSFQQLGWQGAENKLIQTFNFGIGFDF